MASMNTRLNIKKLDDNIIQKHRGSNQVGFKQLGPGVEIGVHGVHDEKRVWFEVELQGAQGDREAKVFQVSNDDTVVAQRRLKDKQPEEKTNTNCLVKKQENEYQTGWKIKTGNILDSCNHRSTQQYMKSGVAKHLGVAWIQQQNGLIDETNVTLFAKVCCFLIQSGLSKVFCAEDTTKSTYLVNRSPSSAIGFEKPIDMNIGFNESGEYKKTFIGSGVGTGSIQLTRDREQHLACELFGYREDSNEATFVVAAVEKIYAHASLTFHNTVACEVISKWKAGLKNDMDAQLDVYVLNNSDDSHDYYWEYAALAKGIILGLETIRDQSGNTLRVSQSRIHNEKLVQTLLKGYSTLSLEDSLSGDCDVEKNASAGVDMLDGFDRGLQKNVQVFVDFDYAMGRSIIFMSRSVTGYGLMILGCAGNLKANLQHMEVLSITEGGYMMFIEAWKKEIWLKGLLTKSRYELRLVAGITTGALVKGCSRSEVPAQVKVVAYRY
ncbi:hypothetical protein Tco_1272612 [Tanacetum coccineum]